ncbi:MAG: hypothetical protein AMQ74_01622 [Candidatus Methanofastidiosum methylothiophilum]|uniref:Uncharacterized protein n=1 Tax=Candidatus Methanofastidiosum methylothiophilum TaxID=1705564 RepID=A0A150ITG3_9EURY|nr:MAG: hypothetical protein AMQ74_01622 [Candidatus Methanofastidiosum methylthiophilus]
MQQIPIETIVAVLRGVEALLAGIGIARLIELIEGKR